MSLTLLGAMQLSGQQNLTPENYAQWHYLGSGASTPNAQWLTYFKKYPEADTLFLKKLPTGKIESYPGAAQHMFTDDGKFFIVIQGGLMTIRNLVSGSKKEVKSKGYLMAASAKSIVVHQPEKGIIEVYDLQGTIRFALEDVYEVKINHSGRQIAMVHAGSEDKSIMLSVLNYRGLPVTKSILTVRSGTIQMIEWSKQGKQLACYGSGGENSAAKIVYINLTKNKAVVKELSFKSLKLSSAKFVTSSGLFISDDGERVFFDVGDSAVNAEKQEAQDTSANEPLIWKSDANKPFEQSVPAGRIERRWVWHVRTGETRAVESLSQPNSALSGDHKYALLFNTSQFSPAFKYNGEFNDYYLMNLLSGQKELIVNKLPYERDYIGLSPAGKYMNYFKDGDWWTYDIKNKRHRCITTGIKDNFSEPHYDKPGTKVINPIGGWSAADKEIYIQGEYDIYLIKPDGSGYKRITNGSASHTRFRIFDDGTVVSNGSKTAGFSPKIIEEDNVIIHAINTRTLEEAIYIYNRLSGLALLKSGRKHYYSIRKLEHQQQWIFFESDFDQPAVLYVSSKDKEAKKIAQANVQQKKFHWGKSELIHYKVDTDSLNGALFYPAGYIPAKRYPMIVVVYEKLSNNLHKYSMPSATTDNGVNIANFTLNGYFVLCPDIVYEINEPGSSALNCVTAAVKQALSGRNIDSLKLGIIGHSFGGYETAFIIGQSKLFKAAVSGAPITDLKSYYLSLTAAGQPNLDKFERYQFRITSPFTDKGYTLNSPVNFASQMDTPLLLWAGGQDPVVSASQSIALQTALWRYGKNSTLLLYPGDGHSLMQQNNQEDLTSRVLEWFGYLLQDGTCPKWMK